MDAAVQAFADRGFNGASVEEISELAGFTRGAFYSNFDSKEDLCVALLRELGDQYVSAAEAAIAQVLDEDDRPIDELIEVAMDTFLAIQPQDRNSQLLELEMRLHAARNPEFAVVYNRLNCEMRDVFAGLIEEGLRRRGVRLSVPPAQAIGLLHAVHDAASFDKVLGRSEQGAGTDDLKALLHNLVRPLDD